MTPLEKAIIDVCEKLHEGLSSVEDQTAENNQRLARIENKIDAQGVLLTDLMGAVGSLNDLVREQYRVVSEGMSSLGARVRTSEQLMKVQGRQKAIKVVERKGPRNESDDR